MFLFLIITLNLDYLKFFISNQSYHEGLHIVPIILWAHIWLGSYYNLSLWYKLTNQTKVISGSNKRALKMVKYIYGKIFKIMTANS